MISREPKGLSLIGPIRRHIHQTRDPEAARKDSVDRRLDDVWSEEGERKSHAGRSFTDAFTAAIASMPSTLPAIISSSHRRPLATADRSFVLASARIGLAPVADSPDGWITSRLRRKVCGDHGIVITLEGRSVPSRSRISISLEPSVILSTLVATFSALPAASESRLNISVHGGSGC